MKYDYTVIETCVKYGERRLEDKARNRWEPIPETFHVYRRHDDVMMMCVMLRREKIEEEKEAPES